MKKWIQIGILGIVLAISIALVYRVVSWKDTSGEYISSMEQLYATDRNLIDVAFVGSSHCYCGIQPSILWEDQGIASFDMAISGMDKESAYYSLVELQKTQTPQVVFVDGYALLSNGYAVEGNKYRNLIQMKLSLNNYRLIEKVDEEHKWDFLFRWPIIHTRYRELQKYDFVTNELSEYGRGGIIEMSVLQQEPSYPGVTDEVGELSEENLKWMSDLMDLSEQEEFDLVFCMVPMYVTREEQETVNAAAIYAQERGYEFIDFIQKAKEIGIDSNTDYCDSLHMNVFGAKKVTRYIGSYLNDNYELKDHRGDSEYYQWDMDLCYRQHVENRYFLNSAGGDLQAYVSALGKMEDITVLISHAGCEMDSDTIGALGSIGVNIEAENAGEVVIINAEKQVTTLPRYVSAEYYLELSKYDTIKIMVSDSNTDIWQNGIVQSFNKDGLLIIVYDNMLEEYISTFGY